MSVKLSADEAVDRALISLEPELDKLVIVGGWALRFLATRSEATPLGRELLVTTDLDVAVRSMSSSSGTDVADRLAGAGFGTRMSGDDRPPVTDYVIETTSGELSVEFVGQRRGGELLRSGRAKATTRALGVVVQLLPHLRPALAATWRIAHRAIDPRGHGVSLEIEVPNPAAYIVQKLLSIKDRQSVRKQERDLLYVVDAIVLFGDALPDIVTASRAEIGDALARAERAALRQRTVELGIVADLHRGAAVQARAAGFAGLDDPRVLASTCRAGLERLGEL